MNIAAIAAIGIVTAIFAVLLKKYNPEYAMILAICGGLLILFLILEQAVPVIERVWEMIDKVGIPSEYAQILFKCLGICLITQFASDSCKDAGESSLGTKIDTAGKIALVVISLPLMEKLVETATSLIKG